MELGLCYCRVRTRGHQGDLWPVPCAEAIFVVHTTPSHTRVKVGKSKDGSTTMHASESSGDPAKWALRPPHIPEPQLHISCFPIFPCILWWDWQRIHFLLSFSHHPAEHHLVTPVTQISLSPIPLHTACSPQTQFSTPIFKTWPSYLFSKSVSFLHFSFIFFLLFFSLFLFYYKHQGKQCKV
jgi:hypothetical protein